MKNINNFLSHKWEYLPAYLLHFPTVFIYLFFSIKSRSLLFFTNISNDYLSSDIENSSKYNVYKKLKKDFYPTTALLRKDILHTVSSVDIQKDYGLKYPVIVKPNIGKRGLGAELVADQKELITYCANAQYDILLQEYINSKNECGIFYIKYPHEEKATITSIGLKTLPTIVGNGRSNLDQLLAGALVSDTVYSKFKNRYDLENIILENGERMVIEPIGAHNRGAQIKSANHLISDELLAVIEKSIQGLNLYYGRLDIKFDTWEEMLAGNFKIIEVNTITSEPLSIYDQRIPISQKYRIIYRHMKSMYEISRILRNMGKPVLEVRTFINYLFNYRAHLKQISSAKV